VTVVVFDVGETLVDETRACERYADAAGVPRFTFMALTGAAVERGLQPQDVVWDWLGVEPPPPVAFTEEDLYPDALPCVHALRSRGVRVGAAGNMREVNEALLRPHVDFVGSSQRWGVHKPTSAFFERIAAEAERAPEEIAYVGDRVDNDVEPALAAGMVAVHVRRGPWGYLHEPPREALRIDSLDDLPAALE
jgi:FMN phosphatase YigB (HAD superfamily)